MRNDWTVIVPVRLSRPLSRLGADARALNWAMAADTINAIAGCELVRRIIVVIDDSEALPEVRALNPKVTARIDRALASADDDASDSALNSAVGQAAADHTSPVAVVLSSLPTLDTAELAATLRLAETLGLGAVPDTDGRATTVLTATDGTRLRPQFGHDSFRLHCDGGSQPIDAGPSVRRTVDSARNVADVAYSAELGARTRAATSAWRRGGPGPTDSGKRYRIDG